MSGSLPARPELPGEPSRALRVLALVAVFAGLAALAGAAFVFSYAGIHAIARQAGISPRLARGYPLILDVLLVVVLAAVLALRGAGWPSRLLAWVSLLALLAAAAGADALHAAGKRLPARPAAVTAAVLPWALVLIAFVLLLAMLRQARLRQARLRQAPLRRAESRKSAAVDEPDPGQVAGHVLLSGHWQPQLPAGSPGPNGAPRLVVPRQAAGDVAADNAADLPGLLPEPAAGEEQGEIAPAEAAQYEAAQYEAGQDELGQDGAAQDQPGQDETGVAVGTLSPAPTFSGDPDQDMPVFHRIWSTPEPPAGQAEPGED
jgi:hypothetical protein